jgi:hypothetical protein
MLHRGKSLILQLPRLHQLFPLFFVLLNIQFEFFLSPFTIFIDTYNYDILILHNFRLIKCVLSPT